VTASPAARDSSENAGARFAAAVLGAPVASGAFCAALSCSLPLPDVWASGLSYHLLVPLWVALACLLPLARSGRRAWAICGVLTIPAVGLLLFRAL